MTTRKGGKRHRETAQLAALAYNDAVRDILHSDGKFHLDERGGDHVWQWDGARWVRIPVADSAFAFEREDGVAATG